MTFTFKRSSRAILQEFAPMFSNRDFKMIMGFNDTQTSTYLNRWSKEGLLIPFGGRSGIYFQNKEAKDKYFIFATQKVFPDAVLSGISILNRHHLTTQYPHAYNILTQTRRSVPSIPGLIVRLRNKKWYALIKEEGYVNSDPNDFSELTPEFALADMLKYRDGWVPDPDDIEFDEMDANEFNRACQSLMLDPEIKDNFVRYHESQDESQVL